MVTIGSGPGGWGVAGHVGITRVMVKIGLGSKGAPGVHGQVMVGQGSGITVILGSSGNP
jgi:hypothetical protein